MLAALPITDRGLYAQESAPGPALRALEPVLAERWGGGLYVLPWVLWQTGFLNFLANQRLRRPTTPGSKALLVRKSA